MAALALHSFMLWGGLLFTGLTKLLIPIRAVALGLGGISAASSAVSNLGEDASGADKLAATLKDIGTGFAAVPTAAAGAAQGAAQFARQIGLLGTEAQASVIPMDDLRTAEAGLALESDSLAASFLALAANPFVWIAVAAAALVAVTIAAVNAKTATQQWVASLEQGVSQARGLRRSGRPTRISLRSPGHCPPLRISLAPLLATAPARWTTCKAGSRPMAVRSGTPQAM